MNITRILLMLLFFFCGLSGTFIGLMIPEITRLGGQNQPPTMAGSYLTAWFVGVILGCIAAYAAARWLK